MENQLILLEDLGYLYPKETSKNKYKFGLYKCFCEKEFKAIMPDINRGKTKSCGCLKIKHNLSHHRLYDIWKGLIDRCNNQKNKDYVNYGARGITVSDEWLDINNFINDMYATYQEGLTIDRENNNKGYSKDNCRWVARKIQSRNTRKLMSTNTSGFRGVRKIGNKYRSEITVNNKKISLGFFINPIDGAKAYDQYIIDNNLEHTRNF